MIACWGKGRSKMNKKLKKCITHERKLRRSRIFNAAASVCNNVITWSDYGRWIILTRLQWWLRRCVLYVCTSDWRTWRKCAHSLWQLSRPQQEHRVGEHVVFAPALDKHSKCHTESDNNNKNGRWARWDEAGGRGKQKRVLHQGTSLCFPDGPFTWCPWCGSSSTSSSRTCAHASDRRLSSVGDHRVQTACWMGQRGSSHEQ